MFIVFLSARLFDGVSSRMRPQRWKGSVHGEQEVFFNLRSYYNEEGNCLLDDEGNTTMHQATRDEEPKVLENYASESPQLLFMLNL